MAVTLSTFDLGLPGDNVIADTNGVGQIIEGTPVYIPGYHGGAAVRTGGSSTVTNTRFRVALGISGNHYGSLYLKNNTAHGSTTSAVNFFYLLASDNSYLAYFRVKAGNALSIRLNSGTEVRAGAANDIPINSWFRLDWQQSGTTFNWRIFYDPSATAVSTPDLSGTVDTSAIALPATSLILGAQSNDATIVKDWSFDTVRAKDTGSWYDPYVIPTIRGKWSGNGLPEGNLNTTSAGPGDMTFGYVSPGIVVENSGHKPPRIRLHQLSGQNCYFAWGSSRLGTPVPQGAMRMYAEFTGWDVNAFALFTSIASDNVSSAWRIDVAPSTGAIRLRDGNTQVAESSWALPLNTLLRIEVIFSPTLLALYVFEGTSAVVLQQISVNSLASATMYGVRFGNNSATYITPDWLADEIILIDAPTLIGPVWPVEEEVPPLPVTVWNGAQELDVSSVTLWDGTQEVPLTIGFN